MARERPHAPPIPTLPVWGVWPSAACACVMAVTASTPATAETPAQTSPLVVCLVVSQKLSISARVASIVLADQMPFGRHTEWVCVGDNHPTTAAIG